MLGDTGLGGLGFDLQKVSLVSLVFSIDLVGNGRMGIRTTIGDSMGLQPCFLLDSLNPKPLNQNPSPLNATPLNP